MSRGHRWSPATREAVREALHAGADDSAIARRFAVGRPTVAKERRRLGLLPHQTRWGERPHVPRGPSAPRLALEPTFALLYDRNLCDRAIAEEAGCGHQLVRAWRLATQRPAISLSIGRRMPPRPPREPRRARPPRPPAPVSAMASLYVHPLYAAALSAAGRFNDREDIASELVVAVLAGEIKTIDPTAVQRAKRRALGPLDLSLDASGLGDGSGETWLDAIVDPAAERPFRLVEARFDARVRARAARA